MSPISVSSNNCLDNIAEALTKVGSPLFANSTIFCFDACIQACLPLSDATDNSFRVRCTVSSIFDKAGPIGLSASIAAKETLRGSITPCSIKAASARRTLFKTSSSFVSTSPEVCSSAPKIRRMASSSLAVVTAPSLPV